MHLETHKLSVTDLTPVIDLSALTNIPTIARH